MKPRELRELAKDELKVKENEFSQAFFNLRFQKATGQLGNTAMISKTKRDLARVKTILRELEIAGASK